MTRSQHQADLSNFIQASRNSIVQFLEHAIFNIYPNVLAVESVTRPTENPPQ